MRPSIFSAFRSSVTQSLNRFWAGGTSVCRLSSQTNKTDELRALLAARFPKAESINVEDVSGGCGAMFEVYVKDAEFKGLNTMKQHRIVTATLQEEIKNMHGIRIHTEVVVQE